MSKKRYLDAIDDMDEETFELLGSRVSKLAGSNGARHHVRERRGADRQESPPASKSKRPRDRHHT